MDNKGQTHFYILPDGKTVNNQKEACELLGIGKNAFRNKVKSGVIKKVTDKPNGYDNENINNRK